MFPSYLEEISDGGNCIAGKTNCGGFGGIRSRNIGPAGRVVEIRSLYEGPLGRLLTEQIIARKNDTKAIL